MLDAFEVLAVDGGIVFCDGVFEFVWFSGFELLRDSVSQLVV